MHKFGISTDEIRIEIDSLDKLEKILDNIYDELINIRSSLGFRIRDVNMIDTRLRSVGDELNSNRRATKQMSSKLKDIVLGYEKTEKDLISNPGGLSLFDRFLKKLDNLSEMELPKLVDYLVQKFSPIFGNAGGLLELISGYFLGDGFDRNNILKAIKLMFKTMDDVLDLSRFNEIFRRNFWKKMVGIPNLADFNGNFFTNFKNLLKIDLGDLRVGNSPLKFLSKGAVKVASKYFDVVVSAFDNYNEHGGVTSRMVAETVIESAVKIATSAAITAGVCAAVVSMGVAAPVAAGVIMAAPVVLNCAMDGISKLYNGKDLAENVSDGIIDSVYPGAKRLVKNVYESVSDTANQVYKKSADTIKSFASWTKNYYGFDQRLAYSGSF